MKMNKKRPFKQKFLKLFWTHVFVILSVVYLVSSDINDLKQSREINEKNDVSLKKISSDQNMCSDDSCSESNENNNDQESLDIQMNKDEYRNDTEGRLEEDLEHPDDQMTSDITGIITTTEKFTTTSEATVRPTQTRPIRQKPAPNARSEHTAALSILDSLLRNYDRRATPTNNLDKPTEVECKLYVRSLGSINSDTMDYQVDLYLRQHWYDSRLQHPKLIDQLDLNDPNLVKRIWKPEVYFPNAKDAEFQYVTVPNVLVRIDPGGRILYMLRLKLKFSCMMELSKFPLDKQVCTMEIASFSKTTKELVLRWKDDGAPIDISDEVKMPQFEIFKIVDTRCQETMHIGNYSCLLGQLHLQRSLGFHMVQSYLPTILIVVISWVSFWMDVDSVAGRTTLGVTTLLTVSSKSSDVQAEVPLVSYVKAIDIWMGACTAFIFAALLEFTLTNYLWRKGYKDRTMDNTKNCQSPNDSACPKDLTFGESLGMAMVAATGAGAYHVDPLISSAAVAGASSNLDCRKNDASKMRDMRMYADNGGIQQNQLLIPNHPRSNREAQCQTHPAQSVYTDISANISAEEFNGNFTSIDTEVISRGKRGSRSLITDCQVVDSSNTHTCSGNNSPVGSGRFGSSHSGMLSGNIESRTGARNNIFEDEFRDGTMEKSRGCCGGKCCTYLSKGGDFYCRLAIQTDEWSRKLFPLAFGMFNFFYWSYYTVWSVDEMDDPHAKSS